MKKTLILFAAIMAGAVAHAGTYALKVTMGENASATYVLDDKPVVTYSENTVTIKSKSIEDTYSIGEVKSFTFVESAYTEKGALAQAVTYDYRNGIFTCEGHEIRVFNLSGQPVAMGMNSVSLEALVPGVYIVSAADRAIKIVK